MSTNLDSLLLQRLMCPVCGGPLALAPPDESSNLRAICRSCGALYPRIDGIWRMLTPREQEEYRSFLEGYPLLRQREGWERDEAYFLALPDVAPGDPSSFVWSIRKRSLAALDRLLTGEERARGQERWALDLGAGNGWLARHLTHKGYRTVALDLTMGGLDSLAGARLYMERDNIWLGRVQASMSRPPFVTNTFSLCVISAALHYAALDETLQSVYRILKPGGLLIITDSPVYKSEESGRAMVAERHAQIEALVGSQSPELPGGNNYLVETGLLAAMSSAGFATQIISIENPIGRIGRTVMRSLKPRRREQARFPVIVGRKSVSSVSGGH